MTFNQSLIIAVDFDGTIVEDTYPKIGKPIRFAFETLKKLQENKHRLVLWSYRSGKRLDEAVAFCEKNGIHFYAINESFPEEQYTYEQSRKIHTEVFIDDRNIGGFIGWGKVYQTVISIENNIKREQQKKRFLDFFR